MEIHKHLDLIKELLSNENLLKLVEIPNSFRTLRNKILK